ncbi:MAG: tRNA (adenosine(37)-N6)-threonylcarbamoyltransferase complex transferase subunit TsaD [bacterium]|nr:tRNA (adenosine(37)-N6)-threonylcarbamoyltransferase complex transferase subunit TsaD [bacterium]
MLILGIETSCDETAAAVVENGSAIRSNIVLSQIDLHQKYGGVVPEIASRAHLNTILPIVQEAIDNAGCKFEDIDAIAVVNGPGLVGALLVGITIAKSIGFTYRKPLVAVNHLHAHIYAAFLEHPDISFPLIALVVSGGHTDLIYMPEHCQYEWLGKTYDDAAGEAFDKVGKVLGLGYPAGPEIDKLAKPGKPNAVEFPRPYLKEYGSDFSFSGLKTAAIYYLRKHPLGSEKITLADFCASFQQAVIEVLVKKTIDVAITKKVKGVIVSGGVAANSGLRKYMTEAAKQQKLFLWIPSPKFCTDNAVMVATAGYYQIQTRFPYAGLDLNAVANLPPG